MIHYTPGRNELEKNMEVISTMDGLVATAVEEVLVDPQDCWQPTDFLPDMSRSDAIEQVVELRRRSAGLPGEVITSLVGNMITEEALPTYQTFFNLLKGVNEEGNIASDRGWVRWSRA
jgi:acyl-[acyl-carrier-protein] desaturase